MGRAVFDANNATTCNMCGMEKFGPACGHCTNVTAARKQNASVMAAIKHEQDLGKDVFGLLYDEDAQTVAIHAAWSLVNHDPGDEDRS